LAFAASESFNEDEIWKMDVVEDSVQSWEGKFGEAYSAHVQSNVLSDWTCGPEKYCYRKWIEKFFDCLKYYDANFTKANYSISLLSKKYKKLQKKFFLWFLNFSKNPVSRLQT